MIDLEDRIKTLQVLTSQTRSCSGYLVIKELHKGYTYVFNNINVSIKSDNIFNLIDKVIEYITINRVIIPISKYYGENMKRYKTVKKRYKLLKSKK